MHYTTSKLKEASSEWRFLAIAHLLMLLVVGTSAQSQSLGELARVSTNDPAAVDVSRIHSLRETGLEQSVEGRKLLAYLISCALPAGVKTSTTVAGQEYEFPGSIGLAPRWLQGALTESEQRWLSACLYARTNYFGISVQISVRADGLDNSDLIATTQGEKEYSIFEGGFFGNLFAPGSPAYACSGNPSQAEGILTQRVCTKASGRRRADGREFSLCGFILTGPCSDPASLRVDGESYSEVIWVYLKPEGAKSLSRD